MKASSRAASKCFMFMYFLQPHWVPATWRSRAQTSIRAELPSGNVPTTRVLRRISRFSRSITLLVRMRVQSFQKPQAIAGEHKASRFEVVGDDEDQFLHKVIYDDV